MGIALDLIGQKFGYLTVIKKTKKRTKCKRVIWECLCNCGNITYVSTNDLTTGNTKSCGCYIKEIYGQATLKHGEALAKGHTREYRTWENMKSRCVRNECAKYYKNKGITVCDRWKNSFQNFLVDMGRCPPNLTLDRIDGNLGYAPENCRWTTWKEQRLNRCVY